MSISTIKTANKEIRLWTPADEVEAEAITQLKNVASLPWIFKHVAVMPDVHYGKGATVGSVIAMKNAVSPAAVGVDIGCGMMAARTSLRYEDIENLKELRLAIEEKIPVGFASHTEIPKLALRDRTVSFSRAKMFDDFCNLNIGVQNLYDKALRQCGTLGGGNHFIELCVEENTICQTCEGEGDIEIAHVFTKCPRCDGEGKRSYVWLMLHSGSRNIGKTLADIHIEKAKKLTHNQDLPDKDLASFLSGTKEMKEYLHDLKWAQDYAMLNRRVMMHLYEDVIRTFYPDVDFDLPVCCHHNYVSEETHFGENVVVTRKGAIHAGKGVLGIIPGSMGTRSYIVEGLGNEESFSSASHGAGRRMSRGKAKKHFTLEDLKNQTNGVECRKDEGVLDEIPGAYKDIDKVMENQKDLVKINHVIRQILCVKG